MAEILLAEDERLVRKQYTALFESEGFCVRAVKDGLEALKAFSEKRPDIVVLDLDMPKATGYRVCEEIRKTDQIVPIVILTAVPAPDNEVRALGCGADDFCSKTESSSILLSHVRRALQRSAAVSTENAAKTAATKLKLGRVEVDMDTLVVSDGKNYAERLTRGEMDALSSLCEADGKYMSSEELLDAMRNKVTACDVQMLYQHISNLRKKLGPAGELIVHQRRVGYRLLK
jgi:DNA-binding response OmpR family regulator